MPLDEAVPLAADEPTTGVLDRLRNPLPEGTLSVGLGLGVSGICLYGFLAVASHAMGKALFAPFAQFWPLLFVGGPGFFLPLEQEVGRALAARRAHGLGGGPLVRRAGLAGMGAALVLIVAVLVVFPATGLTTSVFRGNSLLLFSLAAGLAVYFSQHLTRGTLSGNGRFRAYGILMGSEGIFRIAGAVILWACHVTNPGYYALVMVVGSILAIVVSLYGQRGLLAPGPEAAWTELSTALGFLLATSVLTQALINVGPLAVNALASTQAERDEAGVFLNGVIIARVPLFLFQAVQAALLPKLARYATKGQHQDLRRILRRLLLLVSAIGIVATVGAFLLGPFALSVLFGKDFQLGHLDLGMLAAAASGYMFALVLTPALIALHGYWRALLGWICGALAFVLVTSAGSDLFGRVERGLVGSAAVASIVLAGLLLPLLGSADSAASDEWSEELAEAALHTVNEV